VSPGSGSGRVNARNNDASFEPRRPTGNPLVDDEAAGDHSSDDDIPEYDSDWGDFIVNDCPIAEQEMEDTELYSMMRDPEVFGQNDIACGGVDPRRAADSTAPTLSGPVLSTI
jgi:hypothetical protein